MMFKKLDIRGASHHFLLPVLAVLVVAGIGGYVMQRSSSAASYPHSCTAKTFGRYKNNPAYAKYDKYKRCVKAIQNKVGAKADGIYGNYTQSKVKAWQVKYNKTASASKKLTADGVVGPKTWAAMGIGINYSNALTKRSCNAKNGYVWASGKCENRKAICTHNDYTWSESKKNCGEKKTTSTPSAQTTSSSKSTAKPYPYCVKYTYKAGATDSAGVPKSKPTVSCSKKNFSTKTAGEKARTTARTKTAYQNYQKDLKKYNDAKAAAKKTPTDKYAAARKECQSSGGTWDRNNYCMKKIDYCSWEKRNTLGDAGAEMKLVCRTATVSVGAEYNRIAQSNDTAWNACRSYMREKHKGANPSAATIERYCKERVVAP